MDEMTFYNHEAVAKLASIISVNITDTLKYIHHNYVNQSNKEDIKYFEDEKLRAAFRMLRDDCLEFVNTYDYHNFCSVEPYPNDRNIMEVIVERQKAYEKAIEENHTTVLAYEDTSNYYELIEE